MNRKGIFGLNAVQQFFIVVLGIALLAYVIVIIMGTLSGNTILSQSSGTATNETGAFSNTTGYTVGQATQPGFVFGTLTAAWNSTSGASVGTGNFTVSAAGLLTNATTANFPALNISYTFKFNSPSQNNANYVLGNTSAGLTSFFGQINPVYAILAILVIILVLTVLVRVVTANNNGSGRSNTPQL